MPLGRAPRRRAAGRGGLTARAGPETAGGTSRGLTGPAGVDADTQPGVAGRCPPTGRSPEVMKAVIDPRNLQWNGRVAILWYIAAPAKGAPRWRMTMPRRLPLTSGY